MTRTLISPALAALIDSWRALRAERERECDAARSQFADFERLNAATEEINAAYDDREIPIEEEIADFAAASLADVAAKNAFAANEAADEFELAQAVVRATAADAERLLRATPADDPAMAAVAHFFDATAALQAACEAEVVGDPKSVAERERCAALYLEALARVTATAATTLAGVLGKLRVLRDRDVVGEGEPSLFESAMRDLERIAGAST